MIKNCKHCGAEFEARNYRFTVCDECKKEKQKAAQTRARDRLREQYKGVHVKTPPIKKSPYSVEKTHREILEYEKKHGKRLTYGEYQGLKLLGKI